MPVLLRKLRAVIDTNLFISGLFAKVFDVSADYFIREEKNVTTSKIKNQELLHKIEEINGLPEEDQYTIISFLDAFIKRRKFEELVNA